jgi:hypothetical protein
MILTTDTTSANNIRYSNIKEPVLNIARIYIRKLERQLANLLSLVTLPLFMRSYKSLRETSITTKTN